MRRFVRVCECVYAYVFLCVSEFVYRLVRVCVCVCVRAYIHLCVCVLVYMCRSVEFCVSHRSLLLDFRLGVCAPRRLCPGALQYSKLNLPFVHIYIYIIRTSVWCTSFPPPRCWGGSRENTYYTNAASTALHYSILPNSHSSEPEAVKRKLKYAIGIAEIVLYDDVYACRKIMS